MKHKKLITILVVTLLAAVLCCVPVFAARDVASAVESTWQGAATQIRAVVDRVVFPALDMILVIAFFIKLGMKGNRTVAFQIPEELFERFKAYLKQQGIKQNAFFRNCIQQALDGAEESSSPESE